MIVTAVVGLVAVLALPSFAKARRTSRIVAFTENLRHAYDAFQQYAVDYGTYPPDVNRGVTPNGMSGYLGSLDWTKPTPLGGTWDWDRNSQGVSAGISVIPDAPMSSSAADFLEVDQRIDDGHLTTGSFILNGDRYTFVVEQ